MRQTLCATFAGYKTKKILLYAVKIITYQLTTAK